MGLTSSAVKTTTVEFDDRVYPLFQGKFDEEPGAENRVCGWMRRDTLIAIGYNLFSGRTVFSMDGLSVRMQNYDLMIEGRRDFACVPGFKQKSFVNMLNPSFGLQLERWVPTEMAENLIDILAHSECEITSGVPKNQTLLQRAHILFSETSSKFNRDEASAHKKAIGQTIFTYIIHDQISVIKDQLAHQTRFILQACTQIFPNEISTMVAAYSDVQVQDPLTKAQVSEFISFLDSKISKLQSREYVLIQHYQWNEGQVQTLITQAQATRTLATTLLPLIHKE